MTTPKLTELPRTIKSRIHSIIHPGPGSHLALRCNGASVAVCYDGSNCRLGLRGDGAVVQTLQNGRWTDMRLTTRAVYDEIRKQLPGPSRG